MDTFLFCFEAAAGLSAGFLVMLIIVGILMKIFP